MATLIKANGTTETVEPANPKGFTLDELQKLVGGDIEVLGMNQGKNVMVVNEDGKRLKLPRNTTATRRFNNFAILGDWISGDALVATAAGEEIK